MNNILLKLGIRNDDEHLENCCCDSADSVDDDGEDEEDDDLNKIIKIDNFDDTNDNQNIVTVSDQYPKDIKNINTNKRKMMISSSFEISLKKQSFQDPLVNKLLDILPLHSLWGGKVDTTDVNSFIFDKFDGFQIVNTCTIDYFLLALAFSSFLNEEIIQLLMDSSECVLMKTFDRIIKLSLTVEWNRAKSIWILEILKLEPTRRKFSTFGEEFNFFIKQFNKIQLINYECCNNIFYSNDQLYFEYDELNNLVLSSNIERKCVKCDKACFSKKFSKTPLWIIIQNLIKSNQQKLIVYDLPTEITIDNSKYCLLISTYLVHSHFKSIFLINDCFYGYDDMGTDLAKH